MPPALRLFVAGVAASALATTSALVLIAGWELERPWVVLALVGLAALDPISSAIKLHKGGGHSETRGHEEVLLVFAALLLPTVSAFAAFVAGVTVGELIVRRGVLKGGFNVAQFAGSAALAFVVIHALGGGEPEASVGRVCAVLGGALLFAVLNQLLISGVLALATASSFRRELFDDVPAAALLWAGNSSLGVLAATAALAHTWTLPFAFAALVALRFSFSGHALALRERQTIAELVEWSWDGIFSVDAGGRILLWNPTIERLTGREAELAVGEMLPRVLELRDEHGRLADTFLAPDADVQGAERILRLGSGDGARWLRVSRSPLPDGGLSFIARDITDDREAEEALRKSEERLRLALNAGSMGWWEWDRASGEIRWSEDLEAIFGLGPEFRGHYQDFLAIVHPDDRASAEQTVARVLAGAEDAFNHRIVRPDGSVRWLEAKGRVVKNAEGQPRGMIGVAFDVTERKRLESEVLHSQKTEAVGRLAAGIAHDFNNLMSAVIGFSELILGRLAPGDPISAHVEQIAGAGHRAAAMTQQLLAFSRKEALNPSALDLSELVTEMEKLLAQVLSESVQLDVRVETQLGAVYADLGQLEQVLMNLVINARDAMPTGGRLTIETANVELDETCPTTGIPLPLGPYARLSVSDTGCGIGEETRQRIFEPFFTTKSRDAGTGLGLSTVAAIVNDAGGGISVSSTIGAGTTFDIYLPHVARSPDSRASEGTDEPRPSGSETILLVEDAEGMRTLERVILEECGYTVLEAEDVHHALELARSHEGEIHLLLADVVMPHLNGPQLSEQLAAIRPDINVLYASGYAPEELSAHDFRDRPLLAKPVTPDALARTVRATLDANAGAYAHTSVA